MIELYKKEKEQTNFLDYLSRNNSDGLYLTVNNERLPIRDKKSLKTLLKDTTLCYIQKERGDVQGVILVWKSNYGQVKRKYVKFSAVNEKIAHDLLTILLWNTTSELFIKIDKDSPFIPTFRKKGFRFHKGRGQQILMRRPNYGNNADKYRDDSKKSDGRYSQDY